MYRDTDDSAARMPAAFLSHGAPTLADDAQWTSELAEWAVRLPRPTSILVISAHWEAAPLMTGATTTVPLYYDFYGFAERYYQVTYPAPGAPELAESVAKLIGGPGRMLHQDPRRGLDHGAYVPLAEMYPDADVPTLQISMPTLDPVELFRVGQMLAPLRDEGVLILGSGFATHNLQAVDLAAPSGATPPTWSSEFDDWLDRTMAAGDLDTLMDFQLKAPAAGLAHPRTEHFAPLFVALGAVADDSLHVETAIEGFWHGLSKRSVQMT
ncbi:MAG: class III extradiol ring-cleavage dioxygenase [Acidimicrobiia bacterium]|nr:MAG: class III extradiol ring-cleavage dioxygenase [Acidimicrobiia bacterium]